LFYTVLFKWAEYIALILALNSFHSAIKKGLVYRGKGGKEALIFKFGSGQSDEGGISAVFFERMLIEDFLLELGVVAFFQKKLHPRGFGGMGDSPN
jgi:hypothetical protein